MPRGAAVRKQELDSEQESGLQNASKSTRRILGIPRGRQRRWNIFVFCQCSPAFWDPARQFCVCITKICLELLRSIRQNTA